MGAKKQAVRRSLVDVTKVTTAILYWLGVWNLVEYLRKYAGFSIPQYYGVIAVIGLSTYLYIGTMDSCNTCCCAEDLSD